MCSLRSSQSRTIQTSQLWLRRSRNSCLNCRRERNPRSLSSTWTPYHKSQTASCSRTSPQEMTGRAAWQVPAEPPCRTSRHRREWKRLHRTPWCTTIQHERPWLASQWTTTFMVSSVQCLRWCSRKNSCYLRSKSWSTHSPRARRITRLALTWNPWGIRSFSRLARTRINCLSAIAMQSRTSHCWLKWIARPIKKWSITRRCIANSLSDSEAPPWNSKRPHSTRVMNQKPHFSLPAQ